MCQFDRYRFVRLPFGVVLVGDMLQPKSDEIFKGSTSVFRIIGVILTVGYDVDSKGHDETLR